MAAVSEPNVDVVPFCARQSWSSPQEFEIWWEDPRNILRVVVHCSPHTDAPLLSYWRSSWPGVRVPKGAQVGAGESGWLANDDWTNGVWQAADCHAERRDDGWIFTFRPLNEIEFTQEQDFPVIFRRTLKLKLTFPQSETPSISVAAYTDSTWREEEIVIHRKQTGPGWLEAFNGAILNLSQLPMTGESLQGNSWPEGASRVVARVHCATNDDPNSFDRTIITLRANHLSPDLHGVSFFLDESLGPNPLYIRDLGILVHPASQTVDFEVFEKEWEEDHPLTLYEQIHRLPEQTWERSWANMPRKTSRMYLTLGCEGSRQKFAVEPDGSIFLTENYLRAAPGSDTPRLGWEQNRLRFKLGFPAGEPGDRSILDDELPILRTTWIASDLLYTQEALATWLWSENPTERRPGDDPVVAMVAVTFTNLGGMSQRVAFPIQSVLDDQIEERLSCQDGWITAPNGNLRLMADPGGKGDLTEDEAGGILYSLDLPPGAAHTLILKIPHLNLNTPQEKAQLTKLDFRRVCSQAAQAWRARLDQGAQIRTPNETINHFYRSHLMHMLVINDREPGADRNVARCGGFYYGSFPDEGCMVIADLDRRGLHREAERCLDLYIEYQSTVPLPGNFASAEGVFYGSGGYEVAGYNRNHGWVLWALAEHYRFTRDRAWLERVSPALVKGCDWIIRERQATLHPGTIQHGFLPSGSLEDVTDYWTWLATNAYAVMGFRAAAEVLTEIKHADSARLTEEAHTFWQDLRGGFFAACARSPVVCLRDGTWVPHFPARQERRGRDFGWLREVLEGACHLIYCGLIQSDEPAALWILKDYEDNLFLSSQYGYQAENFDQQWFDLGGFSMQSNLLLFPPLYLWRDEPRHYLRGYFNAFTSAYFPDTNTMCEHALPDLSHWRGDHFKTSDEANSNGWLRDMFISEHGKDLWLGKALPRAWFEHGLSMAVEHTATHFGEVSLRITSQAATGSITVQIDPPRRNPPERILLRVRHPAGNPIKSVWVDRYPHYQIDIEKEVIILERKEEAFEVRVLY